MPWINIFVNLSAWEMVFGNAGELIGSSFRYVAIIIPIAGILIIYGAAFNNENYPIPKQVLFQLPIGTLLIIGIVIGQKLSGGEGRMNSSDFNNIISFFGIGFWLSLVSSLLLSILNKKASQKALITIPTSSTQFPIVATVILIMGIVLIIYSQTANFTKTQTYDDYNMNHQMGLPDAYNLHMNHTETTVDIKKKNTYLYSGLAFILIGGFLLASSRSSTNITTNQNNQQTPIEPITETENKNSSTQNTNQPISSMSQLNIKIPKIKWTKRLIIIVSAIISIIVLFLILNATIWSTESKIERYIQSGKYDEAKNMLFSELQKKPNNGDLHFLLGKCYLASENLPQATESFNLAININQSFRKETVELLRTSIFKALDEFNTSKAESYAQLSLNLDPNSGIVISQKALDIGRTLSTSMENADKLVTLGDFSVLYNTALKNEWGSLLKAFIDKNASSLDNTALSNICEKASNWNPSSSGELSNLLFTKAKEEINKPDFNQNTLEVLLNNATLMNENLKQGASSLVWEKLSSLFSDLKALGKPRFLSLFNLCENYGVSPDISTTDKYQLAVALKNFEDGDKERAITIFKNLSSKNSSFIEGKISSQVLSPPKVGRIDFNSEPFEFKGTRNNWGMAMGIIIQLTGVVIESSGITLTFIVENKNANEILIYAPKYLEREFAQPVQTLQIQDNNGKLFNSTSGFIGGRQNDFNDYIKQVEFNPNEKATLKVKFPMISEGATMIKFISPEYNGWQYNWFWDNIKLKNGPFD